MYGQNPYSPKTQIGPLIESLLFPMVQMLMAKKMYGEQDPRKMPGAQTPVGMPQPQAPLQGNAMMPGAGGAPTQQPMGQPQVPGSTNPQDIQRLFSELSPQSQQTLIGLLQSGSFKMGR